MHERKEEEAVAHLMSILFRVATRRMNADEGGWSSGDGVRGQRSV